MNYQPKTFWAQWRQRIKSRLISLLLAVLLLILQFVFKVPDRVMKWTFRSVIAVLVIYVLYEFIQIRRGSGAMDDPATAALEQAKAEEWKRKIRSLADDIDLTACDTTIDELCDYYDDDFLNWIFQELERMPAGSRILRKAYEAVSLRITG